MAKMAKNNLETFDNNKNESAEIIKGIKTLQAKVYNNVREEDIIPREVNLETLKADLSNIGKQLSNLTNNPKQFIDTYTKAKQMLNYKYNIDKVKNDNSDKLIEAAIQVIKNNTKSA